MTLSKTAKIVICIIVAVIVVIAVLASYMLYFTPQKTAPEYILIGETAGISGPMAFVEKYIVYGIDWAVRKINEAGGVYVKEYDTYIPLKIILYDNEGDMAKALEHVDRLVTKDKVVAILGLNGPVVGPAGAAACNNYHVPALILSPLETISPNVLGDYAFIPNFSTLDPERGFCYLPFKTLEAWACESNKKVALVAELTADGDTYMQGWKAAASKYGYTIVYETQTAVGTLDYTTVVEAIKAAKPDLVISCLEPDDGIRFWLTFKKLGWKPKLAWFEKSAEGMGFYQTLGSDADGVCVGGYFHPESPYTWTINGVTLTPQQLVRDWERETGEVWGVGLGSGFDEVAIIVDAIQRAGCLDPEKIAAEIAKTNGVYFRGPVKFVNNVCAVTTLGLQWQPGGKYEIIYPKDAKTAEFIYPLPPWS